MGAVTEIVESDSQRIFSSDCRAAVFKMEGEELQAEKKVVIIMYIE